MDVLHNVGAGLRARIARSQTKRCLLGELLLGLLLLLALFEQTHCQILWGVAYKLELRQHKFDLLDELACGRGLPELDRLDIRLLVLVSQNVGSLDFEYVVAQRN